ncbi:hypothetical protein ATCV1_z714R [Acanthocystis turfacea chlorella virus 1]|uniref:Uncharacterized protein z714R n=1 Tax=Chlorovirus heliozoae TaxID=322019 RepID=A7K9X4_9PHYC|nr:hypothetical protein ATCV1_z714R [Acanthocystis turfacea chlorella virus 1]ABT16848.1 hypothetical protein ATCV1_z714R [Acanthocystis turfacea chlorella virus 1]
MFTRDVDHSFKLFEQDYFKTVGTRREHTSSSIDISMVEPNGELDPQLDAGDTLLTKREVISSSSMSLDAI